MALAAEILTEPSELESLHDEWDALAVRAGRPYCSPAWMLSWWRHARPAGAELRTVVVSEDGRLVGLAPLWVESDPLRGPCYRVLAGGLSAPVGPLAVEGREPAVAAAVADALSRAEPRPLVLRLEGQSRGPAGQPGAPDGSPGIGGASSGASAGHDWALVLREAWPNDRPWMHSALPVSSPTVCLEGLDYDRWLDGKTQNFRQQARRFRRRLENDGAHFDLAGPGEIDRALAAFVSLHDARWSERGGSNALVPGIAPMLADVARRLAPSGRFRAFTIELEGSVVSTHLFVAAGGEVSYWNGGFDERWQRHKPSLQTLLFAIADAMERDDRRLDLGPGAQDYKQRLADAEDVIDTVTLVPRGVAYPLSRLRLAPYQARWGLSRRLTPDAKRRVRRLLRR